ncbi:MAG: response regulator transcription factor [Hyphomicrobiaceae bacterium]
MQEPRELAIVDDDAAVRDSIAALLATSELVAPRGFAAAEGLLAALADGYRPAAIVSDVRMPGMSGLELQAELNRRGERIPLILVTGHGQVSMAVRALKAGAADFVEKPFDETELLDAIGRAIDEASRQADADRKRADLIARMEQLSPRQREVMDHVVQGLSSKEIAARLGISPRTVETYRLWIMEKTGARNTADLVRMVMLVEPKEP